jgi:acyl carrier protein
MRPPIQLEQTVAGIWQRLLGIGRVGLHDDFFELGGHSLMAVQLMARLHEALGIEVPLRAVFEARTVAALAQQVGTLRWAVEGAAGAGGDREEIEL